MSIHVTPLWQMQDEMFALLGNSGIQLHVQLDKVCLLRPAACIRGPAIRANVVQGHVPLDLPRTVWTWWTGFIWVHVSKMLIRDKVCRSWHDRRRPEVTDIVQQ